MHFLFAPHLFPQVLQLLLSVLVSVHAPQLVDPDAQHRPVAAVVGNFEQLTLVHSAGTMHMPPVGVFATHEPLPLQTMLLPHAVPTIALVAMQTGAPVVQAIAPGAQVVPQAMSLVQDTQLPLPSQTMLVPHVVPPVAFACMHTGAPVVQAILPGLQVVPHTMSFVQAVQPPLASHT